MLSLDLPTVVVGFVVIIAAVVYEGWWAKLPVVPGRFLRNTTVLCAGIINLFDFISFYLQVSRFVIRSDAKLADTPFMVLQFTYQYSFIDVVKNWSVSDQNYFSNTQNLTLTLFAFLAGAFIYVFRRGKWLLVGGLALRMLGVGLMIHSKGANGGVAELVIVQMIQGAGGGLAAGITQTSAQSVVPHQDVAAVTSVSFWTPACFCSSGADILPNSPALSSCCALKLAMPSVRRLPVPSGERKCLLLSTET